MNLPRLLSALALNVLVMGCSTTDVTQARPVRSVGTMTFVDGNTLVIADWRAGELHAFRLPPAASLYAQALQLAQRLRLDRPRAPNRGSVAVWMSPIRSGSVLTVDRHF